MNYGNIWLQVHLFYVIDYKNFRDPATNSKILYYRSH